MQTRTRKPIYDMLISVIAIFVLIITSSCNADAQALSDVHSNDIQGWSEETHSNDVEPDYETVFPQESVNRINITISEENWELMLADMTELMGEFGSGDRRGMRPDEVAPNNAKNNPIPGNPGDDAQPEDGRPEMPGGRDLQEGEPPVVPEGMQMPEEGFRQQGGNFPPGDAGFDQSESDENPIWVTATIEFEDSVWEHVGIRFKGNSSLRSAWSSGNYKIPFKLDFDQFEEDYPKIDDQRFYGFKQLSLANNFSDDSYLREKVTADIFRDYGIASAHTAFYEVYVDYGEGLEYFGLYTMVEMVEDTVIKEQFSEDCGNLYKPEGNGATFAENSFSESSFDMETNQEEAEYSDIMAIFDALHTENRLSDPEAWRTGLESVFNVDVFLRWLAVNTVVQNWDTYGVANHNYFLYTDPETGLVTWIPWDNNMALSNSGMMRARETLSLSLDKVTDRYPLIRFLMDNPVYKAQYETYVAEVVETVFVPEDMAEIYTYFHDLIAESVLKETENATTLSSENAFEASVQDLVEHTNQRYQAVKEFLAKQK